MKNNITAKRIAILAFPVLLVLLVLLIKPLLLYIAQFMPRCLANMLFHIYCPGCGNTRSVLALMRFDIVMSLRQNISPLVIILMLFSFYLEEVFKLFGKSFKSPLKYKAVWITLIVFMAVYFVSRNFIPEIAPI